MDSEQWAQLLPLLLIVAAFWFLVLRPARNRQRQTLELQRQLEVGATVMLTSGVIGEVATLGDEIVELRVTPEVTISVHRNAVGRIVTAEDLARMRSRSPRPGDSTTLPGE